MESRHCGQDKRIFFCPVHNASTRCSLQAFGIRCMTYVMLSYNIPPEYTQKESNLIAEQLLLDLHLCL